MRRACVSRFEPGGLCNPPRRRRVTAMLARRRSGLPVGYLLRAVLLGGLLLAGSSGSAPAFAGAADPLATPARPVRQHQEFLWDFSECFDYTITSGGTDFVDGARYDLPGGCFLRFGNPAESWLQATFHIAGDPHGREAQRGAWTLTIFHLAPRPDEQTAGYAPVRVTLNGQEVWQGSPADEGVYGPGRVWAATEVDVAPNLRPGTNTLRWELLPGAVAPYWLKVIDVQWSPD